MKKFLKGATLFCFLGLLSSCGDEDQVVYTDDNSFALIALSENSGKLPVFEDPNSPNIFEVEVGVTNRVNYDRVINIDIVEELTTATDAMYDIDEATLKIPANSFIGTIRIKGNYNALAPLVPVDLVFDIASVQDQGRIDPLKQRFFLEIFQACPRDPLAAKYNVDVYAFGDQAPSHVVDFVPVPDEFFTFRVTSSWGPNYVAWAAGNPSYEGLYLNPGTFVINCDDTVTFTGTYSTGEGTFDPATGIINVVIDQNLFTSPFDTELVLTPQP